MTEQKVEQAIEEAYDIAPLAVRTKIYDVAKVVSPVLGLAGLGASAVAGVVPDAVSVWVLGIFAVIATVVPWIAKANAK